MPSKCDAKSRNNQCSQRNKLPMLFHGVRTMPNDELSDPAHGTQ